MEPESDLASASWPSAALLKRVKDNAKGMAGTTIDAVHVVVSPYRICPLGAHIDHQGGSVTAMTINRGVVLGFASSGNQMMKLVSGQFGGTVQFSLDKIPSRRLFNSALPSMAKLDQHASVEDGTWGDYARGAATALQRRGYKISKGLIGYMEGSRGFDGGGLSSSASVGVAFLLALEHVNDLDISVEENIELDRLIENEYLGLHIGVLDQSAVLLSRQHSLSLIHCKSIAGLQVREGGLNVWFKELPFQSLGYDSSPADYTEEVSDQETARTYEIVVPPWKQDPDSVEGEENRYKILIAFSGLRHALAGKPGYNLRVEECQNSAKALLRAAGRHSSEPLLGNVTQEEYTKHKGVIQGALARRAEHYFSESARVTAGVEAWSLGDLKKFGKLMSESGQSSIENYECGCEPLVQLREILSEAPGVFGARFSGAGFRGCCVAFVAFDQAERAAEYVQKLYRQAQPELVNNIVDTPIAVICNSAGKAHVL